MDPPDSPQKAKQSTTPNNRNSVPTSPLSPPVSNTTSASFYTPASPYNEAVLGTDYQAITITDEGDSPAFQRKHPTYSKDSTDTTANRTKRVGLVGKESATHLSVVTNFAAPDHRAQPPPTSSSFPLPPTTIPVFDAGIATQTVPSAPASPSGTARSVANNFPAAQQKPQVNYPRNSNIMTSQSSPSFSLQNSAIGVSNTERLAVKNLGRAHSLSASSRSPNANTALSPSVTPTASLAGRQGYFPSPPSASSSSGLHSHHPPQVTPPSVAPSNQITKHQNATNIPPNINAAAPRSTTATGMMPSGTAASHSTFHPSSAGTPVPPSVAVNTPATSTLSNASKFSPGISVNAISPLTTTSPSPSPAPGMMARRHRSSEALRRESPIVGARKEIHESHAFRKIKSKTELCLVKNARPVFRRRDHTTNSYISPLQSLTVQIVATYAICNPAFRYENGLNPRRVLTKPSKGVKNDGFDNSESDYILYVNDILGNDEGQRYLILDVLGQGTFGQVVKCQNLKTKEIVGVKVVKNKPAYFNQSMMEVTILELLNEKFDPNDRHHILRLVDTFIHRRHLCLVFELLSVNLYELLKQNQFHGLSTNLVRVFTAQILDSLTVLKDARIIHCDLKPENILLKNLESPTIKVIDYGSACHEQQTVYTYIQSRFYRSPEVLLGMPYSSAIDMWSLGCIAVELFLGIPLFPGRSEYNQIARIVEMLGIPPVHMIEVGKAAHEFFEQIPPEDQQPESGPNNSGDHRQRGAAKKYRLKSIEKYSADRKVEELPGKKYFSATTLPEIIQTYPLRKRLSQKELDREKHNRVAFTDFVQGLLCLNPIKRWSPQQAKLHPFITGERFTGPFIPPMLPPPAKSGSRSSSPAGTPITSSSKDARIIRPAIPEDTSPQGIEVVVTMSNQSPDAPTPGEDEKTPVDSSTSSTTSNSTSSTDESYATAASSSSHRPRAKTIDVSDFTPPRSRLAHATTFNTDEDGVRREPHEGQNVRTEDGVKQNRKTDAEFPFAMPGAMPEEKRRSNDTLPISNPTTMDIIESDQDTHQSLSSRSSMDLEAGPREVDMEIDDEEKLQQPPPPRHEMPSSSYSALHSFQKTPSQPRAGRQRSESDSMAGVRLNAEPFATSMSSAFSVPANSAYHNKNKTFGRDASQAPWTATGSANDTSGSKSTSEQAPAVKRRLSHHHHRRRPSLQKYNDSGIPVTVKNTSQGQQNLPQRSPHAPPASKTQRAQSNSDLQGKMPVPLSHVHYEVPHEDHQQKQRSKPSSPLHTTSSTSSLIITGTNDSTAAHSFDVFPIRKARSQSICVGTGNQTKPGVIHGHHGSNSHGAYGWLGLLGLSGTAAAQAQANKMAARGRRDSTDAQVSRGEGHPRHGHASERGELPTGVPDGSNLDGWDTGIPWVNPGGTNQDDDGAFMTGRDGEYATEQEKGDRGRLATSTATSIHASVQNSPVSLNYGRTPQSSFGVSNDSSLIDMESKLAENGSISPQSARYLDEMCEPTSASTTPVFSRFQMEQALREDEERQRAEGASTFQAMTNEAGSSPFFLPFPHNQPVHGRDSPPHHQRNQTFHAGASLPGGYPEPMPPMPTSASAVIQTNHLPHVPTYPASTSFNTSTVMPRRASASGIPGYQPPQSASGRPTYPNRYIGTPQPPLPQGYGQPNIQPLPPPAQQFQHQLQHHHHQQQQQQPSSIFLATRYQQPHHSNGSPNRYTERSGPGDDTDAQSAGHPYPHHHPTSHLGGNLSHSFSGSHSYNGTTGDKLFNPPSAFRTELDPMSATPHGKEQFIAPRNEEETYQLPFPATTRGNSSQQHQQQQHQQQAHYHINQSVPGTLIPTTSGSVNPPYHPPQPLPIYINNEGTTRSYPSTTAPPTSSKQLHHNHLPPPLAIPYSNPPLPSGQYQTRWASSGSLSAFPVAAAPDAASTLGPFFSRGHRRGESTGSHVLGGSTGVATASSSTSSNNYSSSYQGHHGRRASMFARPVQALIGVAGVSQVDRMDVDLEDGGLENTVNERRREGDEEV